MTRKEFVQLCGLFGIGIPLNPTPISGKRLDEVPTANFSGKVLIVGAGAGGLSAGYLLNQRGVDFQILEASSNYGGRFKVNTDFADFPIPLGAEWLHTHTGVFEKMVNDASIDVQVPTVDYNRKTDTYAHWENGRLTVYKLGKSDSKFVNYSWFDFYQNYIVPSIQDRILYHQVVDSVDYSGEQVIVGTSNGVEYRADKVVMAVPLKILQTQMINFAPALPPRKAEAIIQPKIWEGFKAFISFSQKFYDTQIGFTILPKTDGQKLYYDAAYGQNSSQHILGLFAVGKPAKDYARLSETQLKDFMLTELDAIYANKATPHYLKHISQNWNDEPFIKAGYLSDHADWRTVRKLRESIANKVYFAGGEFTDGRDWVAVHAAAQSAKDAVDELTN